MPSVNESTSTDYATGIARLPSNDTTKIVLLLDVNYLQSDEDFELISENKKAHQAVTTPHCRQACSGCGAACCKEGVCIENR